MLFSRWPFEQIPSGHYERVYTEFAGWDSLSEKAIAGVKVTNGDGLRATILFTHMQASSDNEAMDSDVRWDQLSTVRAAISDLAPTFAQEREVILIGDLNVRGDSGRKGRSNRSDEWDRVFNQATSPIWVLEDGWHTHMASPGRFEPVDEGYTNLDDGDLGHRRLDYIAVARPVPDPSHPTTGDRPGLVPHHMRVVHFGISDHDALEAVLAPHSPRCTPKTAHVVSDDRNDRETNHQIDRSWPTQRYT